MNCPSWRADHWAVQKRACLSPGVSMRQQVTAVPLAYRNLYNILMKTTLDLNDQLLANAKAFAAQQRTSLTRLIEEGLQLRLRAKAAGPAKGRTGLPVFKGRGGLVASVDPRSNKALLVALDDDA